MKRFKINSLIFSVLILSFTMISAQAKTTFKMATVTPDHHAYTQGAQEFARIVEEETKGEVVIKVYGGGQLGKGERELLEGLQLGRLHVVGLGERLQYRIAHRSPGAFHGVSRRGNRGRGAASGTVRPW